MEARARGTLIAVVAGVLAGVSSAYAAAFAMTFDNLRALDVKAAQVELEGWSKAAAAGTKVAYLSYLVRFPGKKSTEKVAGALRDLQAHRSPRVRDVWRVRVTVRQSYGGAKTTLALREMAAGWLSLAGVSVAGESDPRCDADLSIQLQGAAIEVVYLVTDEYSPRTFYFGGVDNRERVRRHTGASIQGTFTFRAEGQSIDKAFYRRISPPEHVEFSHRLGETIQDDKPEDAPFEAAAEGSIAPAWARFMTENFGDGLAAKAKGSGNALIKAGAESELSRKKT